MYKFVNKNLEPAMEMLNEVANNPEGSELMKKLQAKKQFKIEEEYEKSRTED